MGIWKKVIKEFRKRPVLYCFIFIFILYLLPTFIQVSFYDNLRIKGFYIGAPGVLSGDEPHYFVSTASLINDHDIYIDNNYDNAYFFGGCDVSYHYINNTHPNLGRHIGFYNPVEKTFTEKRKYRGYNASAGPHEGEYASTEVRQVSNHPIGLPIFSSIFLWPLKGTCLIEPVAIYLGLIIAFIGIIFFYLICLHYALKYKQNKSKAQNTALLFTLIFALATQYWHYSKSYFTEVYLTSFIIIAYYLFFIKKKNFIPGFLLALAFSMKYPSGMYLALFGLTLIPKWQWKRIFYFTLGSIPPIAEVLYHNWFLTGRIFGFRKASTIFFGDYIYGVFVWLFSPIFGLLPFAPFLVFSFAGLWTLYKKDKKTLINLSLMIFPFFLFWTSYPTTQIAGAGGYSSRYLIPLLGFFVLLAMIWYIHNKNKLLKWVFLLLIGISFLINVQAAFAYPLFWSNPPWILIKKIMTRWHNIRFFI